MGTNFFKNIYHQPSLKEHDYEEIAKAHQRAEFAPGTILLKSGGIAKEFYVIERGLFRSFLYDYNGKEVTTEFYCANDILIESFCLFQRIPSRENFQAITGGVAWKIEYRAFQELLYKIEGFREWERSWATNELFVLKQRSIESLTIGATERYLKLINAKPQIILQSPVKYIASYLGITDTSLSRIRKEISAG